MLRKWTVLAAVMTVVALSFAGLSYAQDEPTMEKLMEKLNAKDLVLTKVMRTKVAFAKDQKKIAGAAEDIIKLSKESRGMKGPAEKQKKTHDEWTKFVDDFVKKTEEFSETASKAGATYEQAKKARTTMKTACANCHTVFKVEEDK